MATPAARITPVTGPGGEWLTIDQAGHGAATILTLRGELDLRTAPRLRVRVSDVLRRHAGDVVVDMCDVTFIDSTGLAALLNALRRLTRAKRRLVLVCAEGPVMRILRLTRLDGTFTTCEDADEALALVV